MCQLFAVIRHESVFVRIHQIEGAEEVIGRKEDCAIQLPHSSVSRNHASIRNYENGYLIRDLKSRNGTLVNGKHIDQDEALNDGAEVQIGPFRLTICSSIAVAVRLAAGADETTRSNKSPAKSGGGFDHSCERLTPAQRRVFELFSEGLIEKEVAARLGISINTVHDHAKAIYKRLSVSTRGELLSLRPNQSAAE